VNRQERSKKKWHLVEGRWPLCGEDLSTDAGWETVRKWEFEAGSEKLLDVWALHIVSLLDDGNFEDL